MRKSDSELQDDVIAELRWEPSIDHANIDVAVNDGVVTLSGYVKSYPEKIAAEKAVQQLAGVKAIVEEVEVLFAKDFRDSDYKIAKRIVDIFAWNATIPDDRIQVKVEHGWVTLTGTVDHHYQSNEAKSVAGGVSGVVGIRNLIEIKALPAVSDIKTRIEEAFKRQAHLDATHVTVVTEGSTVRLGGTVKAWVERGIAERAAWAAPGVSEVEDNILIG